jgi:hypothetical protein
MFFIVVANTEEYYSIIMRICELSCGACCKFQNKSQASVMYRAACFKWSHFVYIFKMFYHVLQATGYMHHALNLLKYNAFALDLVFVCTSLSHLQF